MARRKVRSGSRPDSIIFEVTAIRLTPQVQVPDCSSSETVPGHSSVVSCWSVTGTAQSALSSPRVTGIVSPSLSGIVR